MCLRCRRYDPRRPQGAACELEQECQIAERELESLHLREREIADLERDRDVLLEGYAGASDDALDSLTPEQRHNLYRTLRMRCLLTPTAPRKSSWGTCSATKKFVQRT